MQAAELFEQKIKPPEVARRLRVSLKSACQWHQLRRDGGREALASRGPSGSRCRLPPRCLEKLAAYLEQGPAARGGVEDQVWTAAGVATLIGRKFHVSHGVSGTTRLMHRLGFGPRVPARRVAERDEQAVTAWKEATWAEGKEPGRPAEAASASMTKPGSPDGRPKDAPGCELARVLPLDAATLLSIDSLTGAHVQVAGIGYSAETSQTLAAEFVTTPWYRSALRRELPPSISEDAEDPDEPGPSFRQGWFYAERVRPAGFRDGVTGALLHRGRVVGLIHLSTESTNAYDTEARRLLADVLPALAALADPVAHAGEVHSLPKAGAANLVTVDAVIDLPARERVRVLGDAGFQGLPRAFADTGGHRMRLLWPVGGAWYRVTLHRHPPGPGIPAGTVLVHELPTELPYRLSPRELEVLTRVAMGQTNQAIAQALFLSPRTVHCHIEHLLHKTNTASRTEATALALRDGLLRPALDHLAFFVER
ncbi:hypothetical protein SipoB123_33540 [Streptomyces ipomoeae]|nr:hypothetical protein SipoB123_33540 [Streptomyces ipomoeae]